MEKAKEESDELKIIKLRQSTTLQDSQDLIDKHTLTLKESISSRMKLMMEIDVLSAQSSCLKVGSFLKEF